MLPLCNLTRPPTVALEARRAIPRLASGLEESAAKLWKSPSQHFEELFPAPESETKKP